MLLSTNDYLSNPQKELTQDESFIAVDFDIFLTKKETLNTHGTELSIV